jgi:membrane associated rhomboid family serine protease
VPIPAPVFALLYLAYTWWAAGNSRGRVNHDAHLDGALTGMLFVALTDWSAWDRALHQIFS